jgi:hypothetical protein
VFWEYNTWNRYAPALRPSQIFIERIRNEQQWDHVSGQA